MGSWQSSYIGLSDFPLHFASNMASWEFHPAVTLVTFVRCLLYALVILSLKAHAATSPVDSALALEKAMAAAAPNDLIIVRASFNASSTIKVEKSLRFRALATGTIIGFFGSPPVTHYGMRVLGTSRLKVSFQGLAFDGLGIERSLPGIYVVGKGRPRAGRGPQVSFAGVTIKRFRLIGRSKGADIDARGAALSANVGARVALLDSAVRDNFASAGGALQSTGHSQVYLCHVAFAGNDVDRSTSLGGVPAAAARDVWVGQLSSLTMLSPRSAAAVSGNATSSIVESTAALARCPNIAPRVPASPPPPPRPSRPPSPPPPPRAEPPSSAPPPPDVRLVLRDVASMSGKYGAAIVYRAADSRQQAAGAGPEVAAAGAYSAVKGESEAEEATGGNYLEDGSKVRGKGCVGR
eukprot:jgi/Mesen1/2093/ME000151S01361